MYFILNHLSRDYVLNNQRIFYIFMCLCTACRFYIIILRSKILRIIFLIVLWLMIVYLRLLKFYCLV